MNGFLSLMAIGIIGFGMIAFLLPPSAIEQPKVVVITIEDLWEEGENYYYADSNGHVYAIGNYRNMGDKIMGDKIMYDDMPKQRFTKLNKGSVYKCTYVTGMTTWISIREEEIKD
jgi:hypothetical protein